MSKKVADQRYFAGWSNIQLAAWWNSLGHRPGDRVLRGPNKGSIKIKLIQFSDAILAESQRRGCQDLLTGEYP